MGGGVLSWPGHRPSLAQTPGDLCYTTVVTTNPRVSSFLLVFSHQGTTAIKHLVHHIIRDLPELDGREAYKCLVYKTASGKLQDKDDELYEVTLAGSELLPDMVTEFNSKEGRAKRQKLVHFATMGVKDSGNTRQQKRTAAKKKSATTKAVAEDAVVPVDFKAFQERESELLQVFRDSKKTFDLKASRGRLALAADRTKVNSYIQAGWHEAVEAQALVETEVRQQVLTQAFLRRGGSFSLYGDRGFFKSKFSTYGYCPFAPTVIAIFFRLGDIFFERVVQLDGVTSYPDASDFKAHAECMSLVLGCKGSVCPAIRNELVGVVVGSLFGVQEEYHLQAMSSFVMPSASEKEAYAKASGYWENAGAFFGIPFRANLTPTQIGIALECLCRDKKIATTIVPLPASDSFPAVLLINAEPPVISTAVNSMPTYGKKKKLEPAYAKFGYHHRHISTSEPPLFSCLTCRFYLLTVFLSFCPCLSTFPTQAR